MSNPVTVTDPWADIVPVSEPVVPPTAGDPGAATHEWAVLTPDGTVETEYDTFPPFGKKPHTSKTAHAHAKTDGGTVMRCKVTRSPWQPFVPSQRTMTSPATAGQRKFVADLLSDRVVPDELRRRAEACRAEMSDGDARELIPLLKDCPKPRSNSLYDHPDDYADLGYNPGSQEHDI